MRDETLAKERWEFDDEVTRVFDDMLARSIPAYQTMRDLTDGMVHRAFAAVGRSEGTVIDLGCSRGGAIARLVERLPNTRFLGLEVSSPMLDAAAERFADRPLVEIHRQDLRDGLPEYARGASVILSVLTLQFTPIEYRHRLMRQAHDALRPNGSMILVEKVLGDSGTTQDLLTGAYHDDKRRAGYTPEEIERKRLSLEGVLVPVTARWNEELLRGAGFNTVECYWRHLNFAAWIATKEDSYGRGS